MSEKITLDEWQRRISGLGSGGMLKLIRKVFVAAALEAEARAKINATGPALHARTERLRGSIHARVRGSGSGVELRLRAGGRGGNVPYAGVHEYGATIRPRKGQFLAIPLGPARTRAGVSRFASPRDVPGLFFVPSRSGGVLVKMGRGKSLTAWFALVRSVRIPARPYLRPALLAVRDRLPTILRSRTEVAVLDGR